MTPAQLFGEAAQAAVTQCAEERATSFRKLNQNWNMVSLDLEEKSKMVDTEAKTTAVDGSRTRKRPIDPNDQEGSLGVQPKQPKLPKAKQENSSKTCGGCTNVFSSVGSLKFHTKTKSTGWDESLKDPFLTTALELTSWSSGFKARNMVFFSPELMVHLLRFMGASSILNCLEAGVGCLSESMTSEFVRKEVRKNLLTVQPSPSWNTEGGLTDEGVGEAFMEDSTAAYEVNKGEVQAYMGLLSYSGCNNDTEFNKLIDLIVEKFPAPPKQKGALSPVPHAIMVNLNGGLVWMTPVSFLLGEIAEEGRKKVGITGEALTTRKMRSYVQPGALDRLGYIDAVLLHALVRKSEREGFSYIGVDVGGFQIDSLRGTEDLLSLVSNTGRLGRRTTTGSVVGYIRVSASIGEEGWRNIHRAMTANPNIIWERIETEAYVLKEAKTEVLLQIWEKLTNCLQLVADGQGPFKFERFLSRLGDWSLLKLAAFMEGQLADFLLDPTTRFL